MWKRVLRPANVLPDPIRIVVPGERRAEGEEDGGSGAPGRRSAEENRANRLALLERRWQEREAEFEERLRETEARAAKPAREAVERFSSMVKEFMTQKDELLLASEESLVRLSCAIARKIVGAAVQMNEGIVLETVRGALKHVVEKETVILRVSPTDLKIVREHGSEWLAMLEGTRSLEMLEDERIGRGGCLVETEAGNVQAQIEKQLQTLERALIEKVR